MPALNQLERAGPLSSSRSPPCSLTHCGRRKQKGGGAEKRGDSLPTAMSDNLAGAILES